MLVLWARTPPCRSGRGRLQSVVMEVTVLLFASLAEKAGWRKRAIEVREGDTVATVRDRLVEEHPQLRPAVPSLLYALNEEYAREWDPVPAGATLAFIPPVSGGCSC
jgi:molybdopterin converting factor subunit 1